MQMSYHTAAAVAVATVLSTWLAKCIYNIYFHPLSKFPGPKLAAASDWQYVRWYTSGSWHSQMQELQDKYGDVVRIGPNDLLFYTPTAMRDTHSHATKGRKPFLKSDFYGFAHGRPDIVTARDPVEHAKQRHQLAHAFSAQSLREQEGIVQGYLNDFVDLLGKLSCENDGIEVGEAFNWLTFDVIGDLAFGESFGAVASGKNHFWVELIFSGFFIMSLSNLRTRVPALGLVLPFLVPKGFLSSVKKHEALTLEKTRKRIALGDMGRADFFSQLISDDEEKCDEQWLANQANVLIIAGSETTATFLDVVTYFLLKSPETLAKLQHELRSKFHTYDEITSDSTLSLPYLAAVIEEGPRICPPAGFGMPRLSPGANVDGHWVPAGVVVSISSFVMTRDSRYWNRPNEFVPGRWIGEGLPGDNRAASQPFSLGPRACIGINLAKVEARLALAKLAWKYDWELRNKDVDFLRQAKMYTLWQKPDVRVRYTPRSGNLS
ncbi:benzoate 4-monooxygenase cytochrome p450 [Seiridium cupressi]